MTSRLPYAAAVLAVAAALAGCGADDEPKGKGIPAASVASIVERLDEVQRRFDNGVDRNNPGACDDIERDSIPAIETAVAGLPADVDPDIRDALEAGIQRLRELARKGCADVERVETDTVPKETVTVETPPPETETTPEETATETSPSDEVPPGQQKDKDKDNDGATPPGQGGGGLPAPLPGEDN